MVETNPLIRGGTRQAEVDGRERRGRRRPELSIVIPAYDAESVIAHSLRRLVAHLDEFRRRFEVLVVDDASRDATVAAVLGEAARDERIHLLWMSRSCGQGAALRAGMRAAHGRYVLTLDANLTTELEALPRLVQELEAGADVAFGDRRHPQSKALRPTVSLREWVGRVLALPWRLCLVPGVRDYSCGIRGYRRRAARMLAARSEIDGRAHQVELVALARGLRLRRRPVPVCWDSGEGGRAPGGAGYGRDLVDLARIAWARLCGRYRGKKARGTA